MKVVRMAGLWKRKDKQGNLLLSGELNDMSRLVILQNNSKKREEDPDYFLCIGPKIKKGKEKDDL